MVKMTFRIVLKGGPKDGQIVEIDERINNSRRIRVPMFSGSPMMLWTPENGEEPLPTLGIGLYQCEHMHAGMPGTTEYRHWYEWQWKGEQK
jgi:hypothetical protein